MRPPVSYCTTGLHDWNPSHKKMKEICSERQPTEEILQCCFARKGYCTVLYSTLLMSAKRRCLVWAGLAFRQRARIIVGAPRSISVPTAGPPQVDLSSHRSTPSLFYLFKQSLASPRHSFPPVASPNALLVSFLIFSLSTPVYHAAKKVFIPMFSRGAFSAFVLSLALVVFADPNPTSPDPGHIDDEGGTCAIGWTPDPTGLWKTMNIELMTGDNFNMVHLTSSSSCVFLSK